MVFVAALGPGDCAAPLQRTTPHIAALLDAYAAGDADRALAGARAIEDADRLRSAFRSEAEKWVTNGGAGELDRRRLVAASLALEVVHSRLDREWKPLSDLIEWSCALLRKRPEPVQAERDWYVTSIALALRAADIRLLSPASKSGHVGHAIERFPSEPRILLAEAVALEGGVEARRAVNRSAPAAFAPPPPPRDGRPDRRGSIATMLTRRYEELSHVATVRSEAQVRLGWRLLVEGEPGQALAPLEAARTQAGEPFVAYLADLFRAWALETLDRGTEAERAYRAALSTLPGTQSASLGLSSLLFLKGDPDGAYAVMAASFAAQGATDDPWRIYFLGDYRSWPALVERLRPIRP